MPLKKQYKSAGIMPTELEPTPPATPSVLAVIDHNTALLDTHDSMDQELDSLAKTSPAKEHMKEMQSKAVKAQRSKKKEVGNAVASECTPKVPIKVLYNVLIFPILELKKDNVKKWKGLTSYFKLDSDKSYDTWKAQLLVQISQKLNPSQITYEDYDVSFTVPCIYPSPLLVMMDNNYNFLLKHHKHNDLSSSADGSDAENSQKKQKNKKKKTRALKDVDINKAKYWPLNKNICMLHNHWVCHKKPSCEITCGPETGAPNMYILA
ncbi:hypothetical protein BKA83DRAFT_4497974 [Pisolithus microcarpus]|nr:hypothetical protein BKA83DRAFT_4497974 [Pisolithus microcarpus]